MLKFNARNFLVVLFASSFFVVSCGCVPVASITAGVSAGVLAMDERSIGTKTDDNIIIAKIKFKFSQNDYSNLLTKISVNAYEGRVMLTGVLKTRDYVDEAVRCAWEVPGVKEVINHLIIAEKPKNRAADMLISSKIGSLFLMEKGFDSLNYKYDVTNGIVYLLGKAQNQEELEIALKITSGIDGVKKVINHIKLKDEIIMDNK